MRTNEAGDEVELLSLCARAVADVRKFCAWEGNLVAPLMKDVRRVVHDLNWGGAKGLVALRQTDIMVDELYVQVEQM